ncbi:MAG: HAMP domain-containing histidine kinase [Nitrospirae bacterium]|nr:HAMP domain-containing histidine kinase [Nitrospirota bacterium]
MIMLKRNLHYVVYLVISLGIGILVTIITSNLDNIVEEKRIRHAVRLEVKEAISAFQEAAPGSSPEQTMKFLKRFTASVMKDKVVTADPARDARPGRDKFRHIFTFSEGKRKLDVYVKDAYVESEVYGPDIPEYFGGVFATIIVFTALVVYGEKKRQALVMQQQFESKHAELRKALEEHEALALLGRMTATLAHELKTPIATISNLIHVLPTRIEDKNFTKRFIVLTREELNRTRQLIDNLLIYGKEISVDNNEWLALEAFLGDIAFNMGIKITSCPGLDIYTDRFYTRLLFDNLMRNSVQAGADEACLKVAMPVSKDSPAIDILYEDDGAGFPPECDLDELIGPFITHRSRGAGLGLYLAQKIALAHGGTVSLYRLKKGAGARVSLPRERVRFNERP